MINDNAKQWLKALKTDEFPQAKKWLHTNQGYCCLGVACELAVRAGVIKPSVLDQNELAYVYPDTRDGNSSLLGRKVQTWLGLRGTLGDFTMSSEVLAILDKHKIKVSDKLKYTSLGALNDMGVPFSVIAEILESNPPEMFVEGPNAAITDNTNL